MKLFLQFEEATKESNRVADQADCDVRDYGKKVHGFEIEFDETTDKLNKGILIKINNYKLIQNYF